MGNVLQKYSILESTGSKIYLPTNVIKFPSTIGGGIKSKAVTLSLSGEVSPLKVGSLSFGSPVSVSDVSKPIFDINATEEKTNISTPMMSGSDKNVVSFGSLAASVSPKSSGDGFADYSSTSGSGGFKFG